MKNFYHAVLRALLVLSVLMPFSDVNGQIFFESEPEEAILLSSDVTNGTGAGANAIDIDFDGEEEIVFDYFTSFGGNPFIQINNQNYASFQDYAYGDFNEDGFVDFVGSYNESFGPDVPISIMLSDDTEDFLSIDFYGSPISIANASIANVYPQAVAVGDVNGDNHLDIVADQFRPSPSADRYIYVYLGDGLGGFADPVEAGQAPILTSLESNYGLELMDFNRDNNLDLVLSSSGGGVSIYEGAGDGSFTFTSSLLESNATELRDAFYVDVDNDGFDDIFYSDPDGDYVILNDNANPLTVLSIAGLPSSYVVGEFTGDAFIDVMSNLTFNPNTIYAGDGNGVFSESDATFYFSNETAYEIVESQQNGGVRDAIVYLRTSVNPRELIFSNFIEDQNTYEGAIPVDKKLDASTDITQAEIADFNDDGINDLIALTATDLVIFYNEDDGFGTLTEGDTLPVTSTNLQTFELVDLEADGDLDIIVGAISGDNVNLQILGNVASVFTIVDEKVTSGILDLDIGDIDNDGIDDLIAASNSNISQFFKGNDAGGFNAPVQTGGRNNSQVELFDMDLDGNLDALFGTSGSLFYYRGDGLGAFENISNSTNIEAPFVIADLNNDGVDDIIGQENGNLRVRLSSIAGDNIDFGLNFLNVSGFDEFFTVKDINSDGNLDVIAFEGFARTISTALGDGEGGFVKYELDVFSAGDNDLSLSIGDMNDDDKLDAFILGSSLYESQSTHLFRLFNDVEVASAPTVGVSNLVVESIKQDSATIKWTRGDGESVLVLATDGGSLDGVPEEIELPVDGEIADFNFSPFFGTSSNISLNNANVIYDGEGDSVVYYNLPVSTEFNIAVIEYNGSGLERNFLTENASTANFTTLKGDQEAVISQADEVSFIYDPITLAVTLNSGLEPEFAIVSGNAEIDTSNHLVLTGLGEIIYSISNPGDDNWNPLEAVNDTVNVVKGDQLISFNLNPSTLIGFSDLQLPIYTSNDLPISYTIDSGPGSLRMSGDTTFYVWDGEGTLTLTASQQGNDFVNAADPVSRSTNVLKRDQAISWQTSRVVLENGSSSFVQLDGQTIQFRNDTLILNATSNAGLPVDYIITQGPGLLEGIGELSRNYIYNGSGEGTGLVTVSASAQGNDIYNTALPVSVTFTIIKGDQLLTFPQTGSFLYEEDLSVVFEAVTTSNLDISYEQTSGTGLGTIEDNTMSITQAGSFTISATQAGNQNWNEAPSRNISFTVSPASQTIAVDAITDKVFGDSFDVSFTVSSGLEATVSSNTGRTSISGTSVTINAPGAETLLVTQSGNANYSFAQESVSFCISPAKPVIIVSGDFLFTEIIADQIEWYLDGEFLTSQSPGSGIEAQLPGSYTAVGIASGCPNGEVSDPYIKVALGLDMLEHAEIYPNPTSNTLHFSAEDSVSLELFSIAGKKLLSIPEEKSSHQVDLSGFKSGHYILHVFQDGALLGTEKIIKIN